MRLTELGEFGLIERFAARARAAVGGATGGDPIGAAPTGASYEARPPVVGIGDDAAVLDLPAGQRAVLTCDAMVEGRHFRTDLLGPEQIGRRAAGAALSDMAAMAAAPLALTVTVALRPDSDVAWADALVGGIAAKAAEHGCVLAGGDTVATTGPVMLDIAVLGSVPPREVWLRAGARPGDVVFVSGTLGDAAAGLAALVAGLPTDEQVAFAVARYADPEPRIALARALAAAHAVGAALDISDGLLQDAGHMAVASGVRLVLQDAALPISPACRAVAERLGEDAARWARSGGEDFELLLAVRPDCANAATAIAERAGVPLTEIGAVVTGVGVELRDQQGAAISAAEPGWDHFRP